MLRPRYISSGRHIKGTHREEEPKLDLSCGKHGVLQQVLPVLCSADGQSKNKFLAYLNGTVQALQLIKKKKHNGTTLSQKNKFINCADIEGDELSKSGDGSVSSKASQFNGTEKNILNKLKSQQLLLEDEGSDCRSASNGCNNRARFTSEHSGSTAKALEYTRFYDEDSSCSSSIIGESSQRTGDDELDFREQMSMRKYFCMLRCCLVNENQEIRAAGLRLMRYLIETSSDAAAICSANVIPLIVRCLDRVGGVTSAERLQALRLIRKLLQLTCTKPRSSSLKFPDGLVRCVVALCKAALQDKDTFYYSALAVLTEMVLSVPDVSISCGAVTTLHSNVLECGSVPRIHEAVMGALLRLTNAPQYRYYTGHLLQVLAPYTDYHYRHTPDDLKPSSSLSEEREQRLLSATQCMVVLLRSWPGLMLLCRDNLAPLRSITAQLAHCPHHSITRAIVNMLYEVFCIRESKYFRRDNSDTDGGWGAHRGAAGRSTAAPKIQGGIKESREWEQVMTAHLQTSTCDTESWTLHEGFVAAEAKASLPHLSQFRPNLVQAHMALVLHVFIKADLLSALCHAIINSPTSLAMRATILLGELAHKALQDLPSECSHLIHALPELMNQAATNFNQLELSKVGNDGGETERADGMLMNAAGGAEQYSSNPVVNIELTGQVLNMNAESVASTAVTTGGANTNENLPDQTFSSQISQTKSNGCNRYSTGSSSNLFSKLFLPHPVPTNPFSIPTHTSITNAVTARLSQSQRKARALLAINALLKLSKGRLNPPLLPPQHSLYLAHMLQMLPYRGEPPNVLSGATGSMNTSGSNSPMQQQLFKKKTVVSTSSDMSKMSKWLNDNYDHDEVVQKYVKLTGVMVSSSAAKNNEDYNSRHHEWQWDMIMALLRWPSNPLQRISNANYRLFVKRIVHFFLPSAEYFSLTELSHPQARKEAEALMLLAQFLLQVPDNDSGRHLEELLVDLLKHLKVVSVATPPVDALLSPSAVSNNCSQYYFLLLGVLSRSSKGHHMLAQSNILQQLQDIIDATMSTDVYAKLISSSLDYTFDGLTRSILQSVLKLNRDLVNSNEDNDGESKERRRRHSSANSGTSESVRMYATGLLRALLRCHTCPQTIRWLLQQLVEQLHDTNTQVCMLAVSVLYEVTEVQHVLHTLAREPPTLPPHLGHHSHLLTARLLELPMAYTVYNNWRLIDNLITFWDTGFNVKFVQLQETALSESMSHHRRDETGRYGRRTSTAVTVQSVFKYPHLYGSLVQHRDGLSKVLSNPHLETLMQTVTRGACSNCSEVLLLKAAVWTVCEVGSSVGGLAHIVKFGVLQAVLQLAANCPVYSIRGTCYMALSSVATTRVGTAYLKSLGWESVLRNHHQRWQSSRYPVVDSVQYQQHYLPIPESNANTKGSAPYFTAPSDDNYIGHTPKAGFILSTESEDEDEEEESNSDDDGVKFVVDGIGLDPLMPSANKKAQTLPGKGRAAGQSGHQRSLSDCAPVMEEGSLPSTSVPLAPPASDVSSSSKGWVRRGSIKLKSRILSSIKKRSDRKRKDSTTSTNSSNCYGGIQHNQQCECCPSPRILNTPTPPLQHTPTSVLNTSPFFQGLSSPPSQTGGSNSVCSSRRTSAESHGALPKIDVGVQLSPIASGGSLSVEDSLADPDRLQHELDEQRIIEEPNNTDRPSSSATQSSGSSCKSPVKDTSSQTNQPAKLLLAKFRRKSPPPVLTLPGISPANAHPQSPRLAGGDDGSVEESRVLQYTVNDGELLLSSSGLRRATGGGGVVSSCDHLPSEHYHYPRRDGLASLLSEGCHSNALSAVLRSTAGSDIIGGFPRTASGISRISSSGSLAAGLGFSGCNLTPMERYSGSSSCYSSHLHKIMDTRMKGSAVDGGPVHHPHVSKYVDAQHSSSTEYYSSHFFTTGSNADPSSCDESNQRPSSSCGVMDASMSYSSVCDSLKDFLAGSGTRTNRVFAMRSSNSTSTDASSVQFLGLVMPIELDKLLDSTGHWERPQDDNKDDIFTPVDTENGMKSKNPAEKNGDDDVVDKDKWRESKRLETLKEESFTSADGESSLQSVSFPTTTVTSCAPPPSTADTGLTLHSPSNCFSCFTLSQRQVPSQPCIEQKPLPVASDSSPAAKSNAEHSDVTKLLTGLVPPNIRECSRPQTPVVDKWENEGAVPGNSSANNKADEQRVLLRKEVRRFIYNLSNPIIAPASESGMLSLKQRWPEAFKDVCLYSEVLEIMSKASYTLPARLFIQEVFAEVDFQEIYDEAAMLLKRLPRTPPPATIPSVVNEPSNHFVKSTTSSDTNNFHQKINNSTTNSSSMSNSSQDTISERLRDAPYIKDDINTVMQTSLTDSGPSSSSDKKDGKGIEALISSATGGCDSLSSNTTGDSMSSSGTLSKDKRSESTPTATDGGIVLLTGESSAAGADLTLSDWEGLSTDEENS